MKPDNVIEEIAYDLKAAIPRIWCLRAITLEQLKEMRDAISGLIKEEDLQLFHNYCNYDKNRYMFIISMNPITAIVIKEHRDNWDYMEELSEIEEVYYG